jgi:hypothetical protein
LQRVLIITYYWPPSGGSSVLRWLKFTRYLRDFGWEPVIYTPLNPEPQEIDESLSSDIPKHLEIIKRKIFEPYGFYKLLTGRKQNERLGVALMDEGKKSKGLTERMSLWVRSNLFIPDPRMFWINPSVRFLTRYLKENHCHAVITTGPPHSLHIIGMKLKKQTGIKWVADFRDPWTNIDFYKDLLLTRLADSLHKKLEKKVVLNADHLITVSPGMTDEFKLMGATRISTITNGYDHADVTKNNSRIEKFTIVHLGSMPRTRNPENLWKALSILVRTKPSFSSELKIRLIGKVDQSIIASLENNDLSHYTIRESFVPHSLTPEILSKSAVLLLCINNTPNAKGILTNKFFEYLAAKRPILAIGPEDGDAAYILRDTEAGKIFNYSESINLQNHLWNLFELYSQNNLYVNTSNTEKYSRKNLTGQLSSLLNTL